MKPPSATGKPVLLTGNLGYIGSVMGPHLVEAGYEVTGLDTGFFRECALVPDETQVATIRKDIRDLASEDLEGYDAVIHLAALSNDPIGNLDSQWTEQINVGASVRLATLAKAAGVQRFLFSSSCIMYGVTQAVDVDENSPLNPQTDYARSKVLAERAIGLLAGPRFTPTFLRNGTVYGFAPKMRFDTVLNDLTGSAATAKRVVVYGDGKPWRPVIHVDDVCRAFLAVLEAPIDRVDNEAFNIGADHLNYRVADLAQFAADAVGGCEIEVLSKAGTDQRTYRTSFRKFAATFPSFEFEWTAEDGARDLYEAFQRVGLTSENYTDKRFTRLAWLQHLLNDKRLDGSLRWRNELEAS